MELSKEYIQKMAMSLNKIFDDNRMSKTSDFDSMFGKKIGMEGGESVTFEYRPSNSNTLAYVVSLHKEGVGIPIELRININLGYTNVILKSLHVFEGYSEFAHLNNGIVQFKRIESPELSKVKDEISRLYSAN